MIQMHRADMISWMKHCLPFSLMFSSFSAFVFLF